MNSLCTYCKSQTLSRKCACKPDMVVPSHFIVSFCSLFTPITTDCCDLVFVADHGTSVIGMMEKIDYKRKKNQRVYHV